MNSHVPITPRRQLTGSVNLLSHPSPMFQIAPNSPQHWIILSVHISAFLTDKFALKKRITIAPPKINTDSFPASRYPGSDRKSLNAFFVS